MAPLRFVVADICVGQVTAFEVRFFEDGAVQVGSETGLRYQNHVAQNSRIMLFARRQSTDRAFYFLGPATYVKHESELPMAITWRLERPLPGDLFAAFAAAVA